MALLSLFVYSDTQSEKEKGNNRDRHVEEGELTHKRMLEMTAENNRIPGVKYAL